MKKLYESPEIELLDFTVDCVLTSSATVDGGNEGGDGDNFGGIEQPDEF